MATTRSGRRLGTLDDLELLTPVDPGNVIAVGANYLAHILEGHDEDAIPEVPDAVHEAQLGHYRTRRTDRAAGPGEVHSVDE